MLDTITHILPIGPDEWKELAKLHTSEFLEMLHQLITTGHSKLCTMTAVKCPQQNPLSKSEPHRTC